MASGSPDPAAALRRVGLRVTVSRLAVHTALARYAPHSSVDAVISAVRERLWDGSAQTVYNVLRTFTDVGLVRRIELTRPVRTPRRRQPPPHCLLSLRRHRRCRLCGRRHPVPHGRRRLGLRDRRSRGQLLGPMPRMCRGDFCLVRRVRADTQRATPAGRHSLGSRATKVESKQPSEGNTEIGEGPTCLIGRM
jgi:Fe2+ or Zn2+ uptake regulation protein